MITVSIELIMIRYLKHTIHLIALYVWLGLNFYEFHIHLNYMKSDQIAYQTNETLRISGSSHKSNTGYTSPSDCNEIFYTVIKYLFIAVQYLIILPVPQVVCNLLGLTFFDSFPGDIKLKIHPDANASTQDLTKQSENNSVNGNDPSIQAHPIVPYGHNNDHKSQVHLNGSNLGQALHPRAHIPHLCFRVVTRGTYPELVQNNVHKNYLTCLETNLINFSFEVVTDQDIYLNNHPKDPRIRQLVVPTTYKSFTGALYKARALQYALELGNSPVKPGDYIIHLDEETIITSNIINGICNFALDGKYDFGQGVITYANLDIVNILTTMADSYRVADDIGKIQFQLGALHRPLFGLKGSFVVSKYEAERDMSYDHGPDGSIAEDCYFAMVAMNKGYKFDFIQGEMFEKSPFTIIDFIKQRKRWVQGIWLVVHDFSIPFRTKFFLIFSHYAALTLPIVTINYAVNTFYNYPAPFATLVLSKFCAAVTIYMYLFGLMKTLDLKPRSIPMLILFLIIQTMTLTFNAVIENVAVVWGIFSQKHTFYVVKKDIEGKVIMDT